MSTILRIFLIASLCLVMQALSACQTLSPLNGKRDQPRSELPSSDDKIALKPRTLERGECGLFVWSADEQRRFILFSQSQKNKAVWAGLSGEQDLTITNKSGQVFQQQYTNQSFAPARLTLALKNIEEIIDSTRFKGGTLSRISADGLQRIEPVIALSACR